MRVISLVPSITLTVADMGLRSSLVGCTSFCVLPKGIWKTATLCGGTKNPKLDIIRELKPTHILTNSEENRPEDIKACKQIAPTLVTHPQTVKDNINFIRDMAEFLNEHTHSTQLIAALENKLRAIETFVRNGQPFAPHRKIPKRCLYLIWRDPYMVAGSDTYIHSLLTLMGFTNLAAGKGFYPTLSVEEIQALKPETLFLSSEPFAFKRRHGEELRGFLGEAQIYKIDGQLMSWWGSLAIEALTKVEFGFKGQDWGDFISSL